jgi:hypothetical protein
MHIQRLFDLFVTNDSTSGFGGDGCLNRLKRQVKPVDFTGSL